MKRNQVFVRAQSNGKWVSADVFDLDDESFRVFLVDMLFRHGLVAGIIDDAVPEEHLTYRVRKDAEQKYDKSE